MQFNEVEDRAGRKLHALCHITVLHRPLPAATIGFGHQFSHSSNT